LLTKGVRVHIDDRLNYHPGWKYNYWELKGIPVRLELGPKDFDNQEVRCVKRNDGSKQQLKWQDLTESVPKLLDQIQKEMYDKVSQQFKALQKEANNWQEFMAHLNTRCVIVTPCIFI